MSDLPNPINRYEKYLNAIATGNSDDLPTPITREEVFLDYIAKNGGGGDIPTKTSDLINDSGFITNLVNNLLNYYLKSETYSKTEVDSLLQAITTLDIQAVQTLPTTNISTTTIYLVPKQDPQVPDVKDEYINLDGTTSGWELIGNTQIDLSNYVTTSDLTTALQSYTKKTYVDGLIGNLSVLTTTDKSSCVGAINEVNGGLTDLKNDILFGDLPSNGFDPLTQCSGFFCYSVYPDKMALQGCPNNYSDYGTIFGCSGTRYKLLVYIDINGKFAVRSQGNAWVTYSN